MDEMKKNLSGKQQDEVAKLRKELKITRYCSFLVATLLVLVIVGGVYAINQITPALTAIQQMQPAMAKVEELDIAVLNEKIEQLDIDGLNQIIEDLDAAELSEALKNINDAAAKLKEVGESFKNFSDSVSNSVSNLFGKGNAGDSGM